MDDETKVTNPNDSNQKVTIYDAISANISALTAYKNTLSYSSAEYKTITTMEKFNAAMVKLFGATYAKDTINDEYTCLLYTSTDLTVTSASSVLVVK